MAGKKAFTRDIRRLLALVAIIIILAIITIAVWSVRYAPTTKKMSLSEYYGISGNQAVLFVNGEKSDTKAAALHTGNQYFILIDELKSRLDDGYVYDKEENVLRYATDTQVISVNKGDDFYTIGREKKDFIPEKGGSSEKIVISGAGNKVYVNLQFVRKYTDITVSVASSPYRVVIEKAGYRHTVVQMRRSTKIRRFGGPKSRILSDVKKGEEVTLIQSYGKWSQILTRNGVLGCVKNSTLGDQKTVTDKASLKARSYNHIRMDGKVNLVWHQVTTEAANTSIDNVLSTDNGINVISPTWFKVADNKGGLSDIASQDYIKKCHDKGVQVWGLVSNFENQDVDTTTVLNRTSARDNLVNNIIGKAVAYDLDGINIDFEQVSTDAKDGYIEFIRELSIKCENNDLILSVDNYPPSDSSLHYNRKEQSNYADYVIVMAYDEHYAGGPEGAGSNSSISFVKSAVADTLKEVPKDQLVLALPFYAKIWKTKDGTSTVNTISMKNIPAYVSAHNAQETWLDDIGQNYVEFTENDATVQLWVEDTRSLKLKLDVMKNNDLAGAAFWKEGLEDAGIWKTIRRYVK